MKDLILRKLDDLVSCFLYYDRKEDEDLPLGAIGEAVESGEITVEDMVVRFGELLQRSLG